MPVVVLSRPDGARLRVPLADLTRSFTHAQRLAVADGHVDARTARSLTLALTGQWRLRDFVRTAGEQEGFSVRVVPQQRRSCPTPA